MFRLGAVVAMGAMSALVKLAAERGAHTFEIIFFRNLFAFIPLIFYVGLTRSARALATTRPVGHLVRAAIGIFGMICGFSALALLPLTEFTAITFAAPLFITALSGPVLGEKVGPHRWAAVVIGFVGVVIMMRPDPVHLVSLGALLALGQAFGTAGAMLAIRQLGGTEPGVTIVFYFTLAATAVGAAGLPFAWTTPGPELLTILVMTGVAGGVGQMLLTQAYRIGPAALVAPFDYATLLWTGLLGYLIWSETPSLHTVVGGLIVIASGLYVLHREHLAHRERIRS
jgi:drug/metabolite transporter (DMT)-like permease